MKMIIDGKKVDSLSGATFDVTAPATGKVIESVPKATAEDIDLAVTAAVKGQKEWAKIPVSQRAQVIYKFIHIVEENKEMLAQTLSAENGKPINEARAEIGNISIAFAAFAEPGQALLRNHHSSGNRSRTAVYHAAGDERAYRRSSLHNPVQLPLRSI